MEPIRNVYFSFWLFLLEAPKGVNSLATIAKKVMNEVAEAVECYNYYDYHYYYYYYDYYYYYYEGLKS